MTYSLRWNGLGSLCTFVFVVVASTARCGGDDFVAPPDSGGGTDASATLDGGRTDGGAPRDDSGGPLDDGGTTGIDGGTTGTDGGTTISDAGAPDAGCTPESDMELCTSAGAECGDVTTTDRCGDARTASCGVCTLPETCGGVSADECGCDVPTEVRSAMCSFTSSGFRLRWGGDTTTYAYVWSLPSGTPASCGSSGTSPLFGSVGLNNMIIPGGPSIGECRFIRLCTWEPMCVSSDYSTGVVFLACVDAMGTGGTCSAM